MNLLNTVLGTENQDPATLSSAEAFAAIALLAMTSDLDASVSEQQLRYISSVLLRLQLFSNYTDHLLNKLLDTILGILRQDGFNALFNAAKASLSPELREAAFVVATDLVLAEGVVTEDEKFFLNDLYHALDIPCDTAGKILQVMTIKNKRS